MFDFTQKPYCLFNGDCLEIMRTFPDNSIDCVITDPPYGTTACSWDAVIPFEPMWKELKRITKAKSAIVLFGSQPFTSALIMSNPKMFKYEWVWEKEQGVNFQLAKVQPLKIHENILLFAQGTLPYYPQDLQEVKILKTNWGKATRLAHLSSEKKRSHYFQTVTNYPQSIVKYDRERGFHATQKPVDLIRYLIKTYTLENEIVLDFTMGSGTSGVACLIENRKFIGIEKDNHYFEVAEARIKRANLEPCDIPKRVGNEKDLPLFTE